MLQVHVNDLQFEHLWEATGIGTPKPRLSWIIETTLENWRQSGYEVEAYTREGKLHGQTGWVESDQSVLVPWPFAPLSSRECLTLRVRVLGVDGEVSEWSQPASVEAGLLQRG